MREKANQCCNFETLQNKVNMHCAEKKILFARVILTSGEPKSFGKVFFEAGFDPPRNEVIIPSLPDSLKNSRTTIIYLWNNDQIIHDYKILIEPSDWKSGKLVYGNYSYR